jgi:molybdopterin converting factor small subunit
MKIRSGMISNSSSTSFIVSAANKAALTISVTTTYDLAERGDVVSTLAELDERFLSTAMDVDGTFPEDRMVFGEDRAKYEEARRAIEAGKTVVFLTLESEEIFGDQLYDVLTEGKKVPDGVEVLLWGRDD